jgi:hypothetical protein
MNTLYHAPHPAPAPDAATQPKEATGARRDVRGRKADADEKKRHLDDVLDEALEETFPASDPVNVAQPDRTLKTAEGVAGKGKKKQERA